MLISRTITPENQLRSGFTVLELLAVMALILILGAVAIPTLDALYGDVPQKAAADKLREMFAEARSRAIEDGRVYRLGIKLDQGDYRIAPDNEMYWLGGDEGASDDTGVPPLIREGVLEKGITFSVSGMNSAETEWFPVVLFNPDGSCSDDREIMLMAKKAAPVVLQIRALTGVIQVVDTRQQLQQSGTGAIP
ncbi:MAG: prepilin-type N-terminal cleavage/methylation domain-containing protein [Zavarzinella sp.]